VRQEEYHAALQINLDNPNIKQIHLLMPNSSDYDRLKAVIRDPHGKLTPCHLGFRMTYKAAVTYCNLLRDEPVMMSNGDVSLYSGSELIDENALNATKQVLAPARWEPIMCNQPPKCHCASDYGAIGACADTYVFVAPLPAVLAESGLLDYPFGGSLGGENVFIPSSVITIIVQTCGPTRGTASG